LIIKGLLLGDLSCQKLTPKSNCRLRFGQSGEHREYLIHLYYLFKPYCKSSYKVRKTFDKRTNKFHDKIYFNINTLPIFNKFYELFYLDGVKVPKKIGDLLTPIGLAYWAMHDGNKTCFGFRLNSQSFTLEEIQLLIQVLKENFDLNCTIHRHNKKTQQYRIYISSNSMNQFKRN
jgi:hypothetical protein